LSTQVFPPHRSGRFCGHVGWHWPAEQVAVPFAGAAHFVPHALQLAGSVCRFTQLVPHAVSPAGQLTTQSPAEHSCPEGHTCPHAPQFDGSVRRLTQVPLHTVCPVPAQALAHAPAAQIAMPPVGAGHALPHLPQLAGSPWTDTQLPPHAVRPAGHVSWQRPFEHTSPEAQACPQAPQLSGSLRRSTQPP
jgi:hypothetical protein